jgi:hypothetical protein
MNKQIIIYLAVTFIWVGFGSDIARAQSEAENRQAAAEAYDRGTAAYLAHDYVRAAQWFETANRMAPASAALIQATRSHVHANNEMRAATLALQLKDQYPSEPASVQYADEVLGTISIKFLRINVSCNQCRVDLDGTLQEYLAFCVEPSATHTVVAHFDSGNTKEIVTGTAGETKELTIEPPPVSTGTKVVVAPPPPPPSEYPEEERNEGKPLSPIFTYIGAGITVGLGVGTIISAVDMYSGKDKYEKKADEYQEAVTNRAANADELRAQGVKLLDEGKTKEVVTSVLIASTAVFAVGTAVIAIFFTQWSDEKEQEPNVSGTIAPTSEGAYISVRARF